MLQRNGKPLAGRDVIKMQEIIIRREAPILSVEEDADESARSYEGIQSIIVMSYGNAVFPDMPNERKPMTSELEEGFRVTDLMSNIEYAVMPWRGLRLLTFMHGLHQIRATVQPDADIVEVANFIVSRIENIVSSN